MNKLLIGGKLPKTFTTKTGSGGFHFYFWILDLKEKIVLNKKGEHYGELQAITAQCLGPGSLHPNGNNYEIYLDEPIRQIEFKDIDEIISDYYEKKNPDKFETVNTGLQWDIVKLIDKCNEKLKEQGRFEHLLQTKDGKIYRGGHPMEAHGSSTGHNFEIDTEKNLWHCYRCERGGDVITLVAMLEGMTDKGMCPGRGFFSVTPENVENFKRIKKIAIENYGFPDDGYRTDNIPLCITGKETHKRIIDENVYDYLTEHGYKFITIRDETGRQPHIYFYDDGYYKLNGEDYLIDIIQQMLLKQGITWQRKYKIEVIDFLKGKNIKNREQILPNKNLINFNNGVYNILTKKLMPHSHTYFFLYKIPWNYTVKHKKLTKKLQKFFESTFNGNKDYITFTQELYGYCLYSGYDIHGLFYLYGTGGNGKSVWLSLLEHMLGEANVTNKSIDSLMSCRFTTSSLYGKLLNHCGELTTSVMQKTDMLKRLTAGDKIQAEFKGKDGFDFTNMAKIITACNSIPDCYDRTYGWYDRQYILPFLQKFRDTKKCDMQLLDKLLNKENMESLLYWSIQGLHRLLDNEKFSYSNKKAKYLMYQGNTRYFVQTCYTRSADIKDYIRIDDVRNRYAKWCKDNDIPQDSEEALAMAFRYFKYPETVLISENGKKIYVRFGLTEVK